MMMAGLAAVVLMTSCFNYINLSTASFSQRRREIGLRKSLGARRQDIFWQFICETLLITLCALMIAICMAELLLPWFKQVCQLTEVSISYTRGNLWLYLIALVIVTTALAGCYPAIKLSRSTPLISLHGNDQSGGGRRLRFALISVQFIVATALLSVCTIIYLLAEDFKEPDYGADIEHTYNAWFTPDEGLPPQFATIRQALQESPDIIDVSTRLADNNPQPEELTLQGRTLLVQTPRITANFVDFYRLNIVAGYAPQEHRGSSSAALIFTSDLASLGSPVCRGSHWSDFPR